MKTLFIIAIPILFIANSYGQKIIKFQIAKSGNVATLIADVVDTSSVIEIHLQKGDTTIGFKVDAPDALKYKLKIEKTSKIKKEFSESDFSGSKALITDRNLQLGNINLQDKFRVLILLGNTSYIKEFKIFISPPIGNPENDVSKNNPVDPSKVNKEYKPGIPYYDALKLLDINNTPQIDAVNILRYYFNNPNLLMSDISLINKNPFFVKLNFGAFKYKEINKDAGAHSIPPGIPSVVSLSSIGGTNVTNFADGIAKFLVGRMKEELSLNFFDKFKETLNDKRYSDIKILFPETTKSLNTIDQDIYKYASYLNILKESFTKDMTNQYINVQKLLQQQKYKDYFNRQQPELGSILNSSLYFINQLSAGKHPGEILANYNVNDLIKLCPSPTSVPCDNSSIETSIKASIRTIQLLSASFRSKSKIDYWVPADSVRTLIEDPIACKIYLGLIYQQVLKNPINFNDNLPLKDILNSLAEKYDDDIYSINQYRYFIETFIDNAQEVNEYLIDLKSKKKSDIDYNDYYRLFNSSIGLLDHARTFIDLPYIKLDKELTEKFKSTSNKIIYVTRTTGELFVDVRTKNYSSAILNTIGILDTFLIFNNPTYKNQIDTELKDKLSILKNALKTDNLGVISKVNNLDITEFNNTVTWGKISNQFGSYTTITSDIENKIVEVINSRIKIQTVVNVDQLKKNIFKYGSFIANVAQAQNSDDVKNAIESIAMPTGSYSIKRKVKCDISLNGYLGFGRDMGNPLGLNNNGKISRDKYNLGWNVSAPVGIAFSKGIICNNKSYGAATLFVSIIDVGSIANFRIQDDTTLLKRTITISDIFSPGLSFIYGFPKTPLSISFGCIYKPKMLFDNKQNDFVSVPGMLRWNISLLIDIPIINFKTTEY